MSRAGISDAAKRFLTDQVGSVERLDLLLVLYRHAARWWGAQALTDEVEMPAGAVQAHLDHLSARNLLDVRIAESVLYRYHPAREELAQVVEEIARAHFLHRNDIVALLTCRTTDSARLFAEAFQLRKGKRDG
jgi:hypothetical protein